MIDPDLDPLDVEPRGNPCDPPLPNRAEDRRRWARLYGSGKGLAIAAAARRHRGPCLVIVPNAAEAGRIADEVQFFGGDGLEPLGSRFRPCDAPKTPFCGIFAQVLPAPCSASATP